MANWISVAQANALPPGERLSVILSDEVPALLLRAGEDVYCVEDVCTHDGQPLTDGEFVDGQITCPRHGARFDVCTGKPTCMPATEPIRVFPAKIEGDQVLVDYED